MEHSETLQTEVVVPPHILEGQRLAASNHYPEYVFSMEFDVLLLEEIHRSKIHRICYAHQLHSFDILRDNLLGTKKLKLSEFSILHGIHLEHQDYPTSLHLQHRFVELLQKSEHSVRWAPRALGISRLLSRRNRLVRILKEQAANNNVKVAFFKPNAKYAKMASDSNSPVAVNSVSFRPQNAPRLGRRPYKDKTFRPSLRCAVKTTTPRKSLPRRKARKEDSYVEPVNVDLDLSEPESHESSAQRSSAKTSHPIKVAHRRSRAGTISSFNPLPTSGGSQATTLGGYDVSPASQYRLAPVKISGISKPSTQGHLAQFGKASSLGRRTGISRKAVESPLPASIQSSGRVPAMMDSPDGIERFGRIQNVQEEPQIVSPCTTRHEFEMNDTNIVEKLGKMEKSLQSLKDYFLAVGNKVNSVEMRMTNLEQVVQVDTAGMDSGLRRYMKTMSSDLREMASLQSQIRTDLMSLKSGIREEKGSAESKASADKNRSRMQLLKEALKSTVLHNVTLPCHNDINQSEKNAASTFNTKQVETEERNNGHSGDVSDIGQPGEAPYIRKSKRTRSADRMQEKDHPSMLSTFATRFTRMFCPTEKDMTES